MPHFPTGHGDYFFGRFVLLRSRGWFNLIRGFLVEIWIRKHWQVNLFLSVYCVSEFNWGIILACFLFPLIALSSSKKTVWFIGKLVYKMYYTFSELHLLFDSVGAYSIFVYFISGTTMVTIQNSASFLCRRIKIKRKQKFLEVKAGEYRLNLRIFPSGEQTGTSWTVIGQTIPELWGDIRPLDRPSFTSDGRREISNWAAFIWRRCMIIALTR